MADIPWSDWQFWVVTAVALTALIWFIRTLRLFSTSSPNNNGATCSSCPTGNAASRAQRKGAQLTVDRQRV